MKSILALLMLLVGVASGAAQAPQRVVSFNLCADQLVLALADPQQIAGLSPYAADPALSVMAKEAQPYPRLDWSAETAVAYGPDLVLVGPTHRSVMQRMMRALGLHLEEVALITDIEAARAQIRSVAALLGHAERGEALLARLDAARARLAAAPRPARGTALLIERGGYAAGPASLAAAVLQEAGLTPPPGAPDGFGGTVPLERLFVLRPDYVVLKDAPGTPTDQGALYLTHPALRALYPPERRIMLPGRYTMCGGPALVAALNHLADVLTQLAK